MKKINLSKLLVIKVGSSLTTLPSGLPNLKFVKITKIDVGTKKDLFTSYRLDFNGREKLNLFKKKYKNILL